MNTLCKPFHSINLGDDEVCCVAFSPFEWSRNFLAIGTCNKVAVCNVNTDNEEMEFEIVHEFHHPCPVVSVVWSPVSSSDAVPKICCFATAGSDGKIRIFNSDLASVHDVLELTGHSDYVNCVAFHPDMDCTFIASVSDDLTCKIWSTSDGKLLKTIPLDSEGMAVRFNWSDPTKFLVLEKSGLVRILSVNGFSPMTSMSNSYSCQDPALDADWSPSDPSHLVTALGGRVLHWNLNRIGFPEDEATVVGESVQKIRFHPSLDNYLAVLSCPGPIVTVLLGTGNALLTEPLVAASDLSWHRHLPLLAVANDRTVRFWKLLTK